MLGGNGSLDISVGGRSPGLCKQKPHLISGKRQPPFLWHDQTFLSPHKEEWLDSKSGKNKSVAAEENRKTFVDINRLLLKAILGPVEKPCKLTLSSSPSSLSLYNQTDIETYLCSHNHNLCLQGFLGLI